MLAIIKVDIVLVTCHVVNFEFWMGLKNKIYNIITYFVFTPTQKIQNFQHDRKTERIGLF